MPRTIDLVPTYLPDEYVFRRRIEGLRSPGFFEQADQVVLIFTKGQSREDWRWPLTVHATADRLAQLDATENHPGASLDLGVPGAAALYHDGWWSPAAPNEGGFTWVIGTVHSLTIRTADNALAVRAPRSVSFNELVSVAFSLPPVRNAA